MCADDDDHDNECLPFTLLYTQNMYRHVLELNSKVSSPLVSVLGGRWVTHTRLETPKNELTTHCLVHSHVLLFLTSPVLWFAIVSCHESWKNQTQLIFLFPFIFLCCVFWSSRFHILFYSTYFSLSAGAKTSSSWSRVDTTLVQMKEMLCCVQIESVQTRSQRFRRKQEVRDLARISRVVTHFSSRVRLSPTAYTTASRSRCRAKSIKKYTTEKMMWRNKVSFRIWKEMCSEYWKRLKRVEWTKFMTIYLRQPNQLSLLTISRSSLGK